MPKSLGAQVFPLILDVNNQIHSRMMELLNTEPDCVLVITIMNVFWWSGYFGRRHAPVWLCGRKSTCLVPVLGSQHQSCILSQCQACPWDAGWEGERVLHHESSGNRRVFNYNITWPGENWYQCDMWDCKPKSLEKEEKLVPPSCAGILSDISVTQWLNR